MASERRHARLGPSSSEIWTTCAGAPREWAKRPPKKAGWAAHEGVLAHTLCEAAIKRGGQVAWQAGQTFTVEGSIVEITPEMLDAVRMFVQTVFRLADTALWRATETEVSLSWLWGDEEPPDDIFGTTDFAACDLTTLYVLDFKYGRGKAVGAERNTQLLMYALMVYGKLQNERPDLIAAIETVCLVIIQPRAGGLKTWAIPVGELLYWGYGVLKPKIDAICDPLENLELTPGNHCYFCAAAIDCEAYAQHRTAKSVASFPDVTEDMLEPV